MLWAHVPVLAVLGLLRGKGPAHAAEEAALIAALAVASRIYPGRAWRSCLTSLGLLSSSAVLIHLSGGLTEAHFHFFVVLGLIALYHDWRPYLVAFGFVLAYHGVLGVLVPRAIYHDPAAVAHPVLWAVLHAGFILTAGAVQLTSWRAEERAWRMLAQAQQVALERDARLELVAARAEAAERSARLLRVTAALSEALTPSEVAHVVLEEGCSVLGAQGGGVAVRAEGTDRLKVMLRGFDDDLRARWTAVPLGLDAPLTEAVRDGTPVLCEDRRALLTRYPALAADLVQARVEACAALPLTASGTTLGAVLVTFAAPRSFDAAERSFLLTLASQCAQALERARLYELEHEMADTLQRSLLPERLPEVPGLAAVGRYLPGARGRHVGGDWYDCIELPGGRLALALGDVVGKGVRAASLMGQLRNAVRAYAVQELDPALVVQWTDRLGTLGQEELATLVYGVLDAQARTFRFANAGHLPPLVLSGHGAARFVEGEPALPLGVDDGRGAGPELCVDLSPGDVILLYSDGLVEERGEGLDDGLARLAAAAGRALRRHPGDLDRLCDALLADLRGHLGGRDDSTLLAVRFAPAPTAATAGDGAGQSPPVALTRR